MSRHKPDLHIWGFVDEAAFVAAVWFTYSVIRNARDLIEHGTKDAPASYALILAIVLLAYSRRKNKKFNTWHVVTLTILATSLALWLFGLSAQATYSLG